MSWTSTLVHRARRAGKTHAMAKATKKLNGILVCMNQREADRVRKEFGIRTFSAHMHADHLRGTLGPIIFDPDAVHSIAYDYETCIRKLEAENRALKAKLDRINRIINERSADDELG